MARTPKWHLYFVETPSPDENCFVASTSAASAAKLEREGSGFGGQDCKAFIVRDLNVEWVRERLASGGEGNNAFYVQDEELSFLGISHEIIEGDDLFSFEGETFVRQGGLNYIAGIVEHIREHEHNIVIRSVGDLLHIIKRDAEGKWIFRGQASCKWPLLAGIHRINTDQHELAALRIEKQLFSEFRRQARAFLPNPPSSLWEWLIIGQHFGLPTRLLDWTENPLEHAVVRRKRILSF